MAIDIDESKNTLFGNIKKSDTSTSFPANSTQKTSIVEENIARRDTIEQTKESPDIPSRASQQLQEFSAHSKAKWHSFDKVTALLTTEQKEGLDRVARKIMKFRAIELKGKDDKERITANTLIRALIENFLRTEESLKMEVLSSEDDIHEWVRGIFK